MNSPPLLISSAVAASSILSPPPTTQSYVLQRVQPVLLSPPLVSQSQRSPHSPRLLSYSVNASAAPMAGSCLAVPLHAAAVLRSNLVPSHVDVAGLSFGLTNISLSSSYTSAAPEASLQSQALLSPPHPLAQPPPANSVPTAVQPSASASTSATASASAAQSKKASRQTVRRKSSSGGQWNDRQRCRTSSSSQQGLNSRTNSRTHSRSTASARSSPATSHSGSSSDIYAGSNYNLVGSSNRAYSPATPDCSESPPSSSTYASLQRGIGEALNLQIYLLQQCGPNSFLVGVDNEYSNPSNAASVSTSPTHQKFKVFIGPQVCSCGRSPACPHLIFIMHRVFELPLSDPRVRAKTLKNYETDALLARYAERRATRFRKSDGRAGRSSKSPKPCAPASASVSATASGGGVPASPPPVSANACANNLTATATAAATENNSGGKAVQLVDESTQTYARPPSVIPTGVVRPTAQTPPGVPPPPPPHASPLPVAVPLATSSSSASANRSAALSTDAQSQSQSQTQTAAEWAPASSRSPTPSEPICPVCFADFSNVNVPVLRCASGCANRYHPRCISICALLVTFYADIR